MTVDQILEAVRNHGFERLTATARLDAVNDAYFDVCSRQPWQFLTQFANLTGSGSVIITPDTSKILVVADSVSRLPLRFVSMQEYQQIATPSDSISNPQIYSVLGNQDVLYFPYTGAGRTFWVTYLRRPVPLAAGGTEASVLIPRQHHQVIVDGSVARLWDLVRKPDRARPHFEAVERRVQSMAGDLVSADMSRPESVDPINPDDK